eukprot:3273407-Prymnesium_polylepis.1
MYNSYQLLEESRASLPGVVPTEGMGEAQHVIASAAHVAHGTVVVQLQSLASGGATTAEVAAATTMEALRAANAASFLIVPKTGVQGPPAPPPFIPYGSTAQAIGGGTAEQAETPIGLIIFAVIFSVAVPVLYLERKRIVPFLLWFFDPEEWFARVDRIT